MTQDAQIRTAADFGYRLREEREKRGITQADLAARAGVSIRWLSNFERGKSPRAELIKVLHVTRALGLAFEVAQERERRIAPSQQALVEAFKNSSGAGSKLAMTEALHRLNETSSEHGEGDGEA